MWAKIRAADANVNDVADTLSGIALPLTTAHAIGEGCHLVQYCVDFQHHIFSVNKDGLIFGSTQGDVQDGTVLCDVNLISLKHGINALTQSCRLGQWQNEAQRLIIEAVL